MAIEIKKEDKASVVNAEKVKIPFKLRIKKALLYLKEFLLNLDIDTLFLFLTTFVVIEFPLVNRILLSIGIMYLYKMIVKDIMKISIIKK